MKTYDDNRKFRIVTKDNLEGHPDSQAVCQIYLVSIDRLKRLVDIEQSDVITFAGPEFVDDFAGMLPLLEKVAINKTYGEER